MIIISSVIAAAMAISVMIVRIKASDKPASPKNNSPADFHEYGSAYVPFPIFRVTGEEFLEAITLGVIFYFSD